MFRDRVENFLNKHSILQIGAIYIIFIIAFMYIGGYILDLVNVLDVTAVNTKTIEKDIDNLVEVDKFTIDNDKLTINNRKKKYENVNYVFYMPNNKIKDSVYFSVKSNTLIQPLKKDFCLTFLVTTKFIIVMISMIVITILIRVVVKMNKLKYWSNILFYFGLFIDFVLIILLFLTLLLLC